LAAAADNIKGAVLTALSSRASQQNELLIQRYQAMEVNISKACENSEQAVAMRNLQLQHNQQQEQMRMEIANNKAVMAFLAEQLFPISQADLDAGARW
jgi:hypothetical protein